MFVPNLKNGRWNGEISVESAVASEAILDDDTMALRKMQLLLVRIAGPVVV